MRKETTARSKTPASAPGDDNSFRLLVESVKDYAIIMLDPSGHVASWNAGAERFKGYRAAGDHRQALLLLLSAGGRAARPAGTGT